MSKKDCELNAIWSHLIVEELVRNGVECFCLASGSRCAPLTVAVARHPRARGVRHVDERGLAYFALGYAKATGTPAAIVTTSGTAVANLMPAVCEAHEDRIPMLILTADRPPELRCTQANQTMVQPNIFGERVRWMFDVPCPTSEMDGEFVLTTVDQALYRCRRSPSGPVHLNLMFREPLSPSGGVEPWSKAPGPIERWQSSDTPFTVYPRTCTVPQEDTVPEVVESLQAVEHGVLVVGELRTTLEKEAVKSIAESLNWPVFNDVTSGLRLGGMSDEVHIPHYEAILLDPEFSMRVEGVLQLGGRIVSKRLLLALASSNAPIWIQVADHPERHDPLHRVSMRIESSLTEFAKIVANMTRQKSNGNWLQEWHVRNQSVEKLYTTFVGTSGEITEPAVARLLSTLLPVDHGLCLASSMPVRDVNEFAVSEGMAVEVCSNRGVSGIDGTLSTAVGFATGTSMPITLLLGDLSFLHDLNALDLVRRSEVPITVVVINNDGGGIFHFLPISEQKDIFEPWFGTPHGLHFDEVAAMYGMEYDRPTSMESFRESYGRLVRTGRSSIIEVITNREENVALHRMLEDRIRSLWVRAGG